MEEFIWRRAFRVRPDCPAACGMTQAQRAQYGGSASAPPPECVGPCVPPEQDGGDGRDAANHRRALVSGLLHKLRTHIERTGEDPFAAGNAVVDTALADFWARNLQTLYADTRVFRYDDPTVWPDSVRLHLGV
jgi:hypothetical protein